MANLENIMGGSINGYGGIDVNYQATGFSVGSHGQIMNGYQDTGCRLTNGGSIRDAYGMSTGFGLTRQNSISRYY